MARSFLGPLFICFSPIAKLTHPLAPSPIAAAFQSVAHQGFNLLVADPIFSLNICKAHMIWQRHLNDCADMVWREGVWLFHGDQVGESQKKTSGPCEVVRPAFVRRRKVQMCCLLDDPAQFKQGTGIQFLSLASFLKSWATKLSPLLPWVLLRAISLRPRQSTKFRMQGLWAENHSHLNVHVRRSKLDTNWNWPRHSTKTSRQNWKMTSAETC